MLWRIESIAHVVEIHHELLIGSSQPPSYCEMTGYNPRVSVCCVCVCVCLCVCVWGLVSFPCSATPKLPLYERCEKEKERSESGVFLGVLLMAGIWLKLSQL